MSLPQGVGRVLAGVQRGCSDLDSRHSGGGYLGCWSIVSAPPSPPCACTQRERERDRRTFFFSFSDKPAVPFSAYHFPSCRNMYVRVLLLVVRCLAAVFRVLAPRGNGFRPGLSISSVLLKARGANSAARAVFEKRECRVLPCLFGAVAMPCWLATLFRVWVFSTSKYNLVVVATIRDNAS